MSVCTLAESSFLGGPSVAVSFTDMGQTTNTACKATRGYHLVHTHQTAENPHTHFSSGYSTCSFLSTLSNEARLYLAGWEFEINKASFSWFWS